MSNHHCRKSIAYLVAYAPLIFFAVLLAGVILHINLPVGFITPAIGWAVGAAMMIVSPVLIVWAQQVRHTLYVPVDERTCTNFNVGPYKISRHPTYLGLFMAVIGMAFLIDSLPLLIMALGIGPLFTFFIIPYEETLVEKMCGGVYQDYKKKVRMWV